MKPRCLHGRRLLDSTKHQIEKYGLEPHPLALRINQRQDNDEYEMSEVSLRRLLSTPLRGFLRLHLDDVHLTVLVHDSTAYFVWQQKYPDQTDPPHVPHSRDSPSTLTPCLYDQAKCHIQRIFQFKFCQLLCLPSFGVGREVYCWLLFRLNYSQFFLSFIVVHKVHCKETV